MISSMFSTLTSIYRAFLISAILVMSLAGFGCGRASPATSVPKATPLREALLLGDRMTIAIDGAIDVKRALGQSNLLSRDEERQWTGRLRLINKHTVAYIKSVGEFKTFDLASFDSIEKFVQDLRAEAVAMVNDTTLGIKNQQAQTSITSAINIVVDLIDTFLISFKTLKGGLSNDAGRAFGFIQSWTSVGFNRQQNYRSGQSRNGIDRRRIESSSAGAWGFERCEVDRRRRPLIVARLTGFDLA